MTYKNITFAFILSLFLINCDDNNGDLGFNPTPEVGWIQFNGTLDSPLEESFNQAFDVDARVGVNLQIPQVNNDLTITYDLLPVSGVNPNMVFSNSGSIVSPAGLTSYAGPDNNTGSDFTYLADIIFDLSELPNLSEPMVFDIVLTGTDSGTVQVGLNGEKPTVQRVTICPNLSSENSAAAPFLGVYEVFNVTPTALLASEDPIIAETQVTITQGTDGPFSRTFSFSYLGGTFLEAPFQVNFTFTPEGIALVNENFQYPDTVVCNADITEGIAFGFDNDSLLLPLPCDLETHEIVFNFLEAKFIGDPDDENDTNGTGGCNDGNLAASFSIRKL